MRLNPYFRYGLYSAFFILVVTGLTWLLADSLKATSSGEAWQALAADLLMVHGGTAMVTLMLLGALVPQHIRRGWITRRNRLSGLVMVTFNSALIVTAFGLYYVGSETLRHWISNSHLIAGLGLPVLIVVHVLIGRRSI